ncbi:hypothetical protein BGZ60DRAFT_516542 [Tricladium varicosporioides]|nr:hypothetical protein BGZ60DRAFT_516542 [Hymenoscyphus varicosporioides]
MQFLIPCLPVLLALTFHAHFVFGATQSAAAVSPTITNAAIPSISPCPTTAGNPAYTSADACFSSLFNNYLAACGTNNCDCWLISQGIGCFEKYCPGYETRQFASNTDSILKGLAQWKSTTESCAKTPGFVPTGTKAVVVVPTATEGGSTGTLSIGTGQTSIKASATVFEGSTGAGYSGTTKASATIFEGQSSTTAAGKSGAMRNSRSYGLLGLAFALGVIGLL